MNNSITKDELIAEMGLMIMAQSKQIEMLNKRLGPVAKSLSAFLKEQNLGTES